MKFDERMEELASLYVLGALEGPELVEFTAALGANAGLREFVAKLGQSVEAMAGVVPAIEPPPQLRAKILAQVELPQKIVTLPDRSGINYWFLLLRLFATGLSAMVIVLFVHDGRLHRIIEAQAKQIDQLHQLAQSLQSATNNLNQTVLALRESNRLANVRISMLNSLVADAPKTVGVTLWDGQGGVFVVENLKAVPANRDYELWVMDEHKVPVAAGVFHMDDSGTTRIDFKPVRSIQQAGQFCVTEEVKGGVASPTLKNLVLASN